MKSHTDGNFSAWHARFHPNRQTYLTGVILE